MKKLEYEKPRLIQLNEVSYGACTQGSGVRGTCRTGFTPSNHVCFTGGSTTNCIHGHGARLSLAVPEDIANQ